MTSYRLSVITGVLVLLATSCAFGQPTVWWKLSMATMAGANAADAVTSIEAQHRLGCREQNVFFGPCFRTDQVLIKAGYVGFEGVVQCFLVRWHPHWARWLAIFNAGQSISPSWAAWHNSRIAK